MKWSPLDKARNYGTPVVAETSDWLVNSVLRDSRLSEEDIKKGFQNLKSLEDGGKIQEGQFGGGAGMTCVSCVPFSQSTWPSLLICVNSASSCRWNRDLEQESRRRRRQSARVQCVVCLFE